MQFLFLTAGWWVAHEMWRLVRPDTPTDTDLAGLQDFLLSDENGLIGAAIGMGYVSTLATAICHFLIKYFVFSKAALQTVILTSL